MASSIVDGPSFRDLCLDLGVPHRCLSRHEADLSAKLCEVVKDRLHAQATHLIGCAGMHAILFTYGSDGTPALTKFTATARLSSGRLIRRKRGRGVEYLIERGFLKTMIGGRPRVACVLRDPIPLLNGKGAWDCFAALTKFFPMVRRLGFRGILVEHYAFDRLLQASLSRKVQQRANLYYAAQSGEEGAPDDLALLEMKHWVVCTGCAAHDAHNALKWSLLWASPDPKDTLKRLHITVESLRNGFDLVHGKLQAFLVDVLVFKSEVPCYAESCEFWTLLGVPEEVADTLSELGVCWDGQYLSVSQTFATDPGLLAKLSTCLIAIFEFHKFTDSRWLTVGESCRSLVAATAVGLQRLVASILESPSTSQYYIGGFAKLDDATLRWATLAAISSRLSDSLLKTMLKDDRLAKRASVLTSTMQHELDALLAVSDPVWVRLSSVLQNSSSKLLRSQVIYSGNIAAAFFLSSGS
jgi:hypothetical protein